MEKERERLGIRGWERESETDRETKRQRYRQTERERERERAVSYTHLTLPTMAVV